MASATHVHARLLARAPCTRKASPPEQATAAIVRLERLSPTPPAIADVDAKKSSHRTP